MCISVANFFTSSVSLSSSMETPTTCNPCATYWFCKSTIQGVSILQGAHHVAQKFTRTALPRKSESFRVFPSKVFSAKFGAGAPRNAPRLLFPSVGLIFFAAKIISVTPARIATSTRKVRFIAQTPCSQSKPVQKRKISRNHVKAPHHQQYAQDNQ